MDDPNFLTSSYLTVVLSNGLETQVAPWELHETRDGAVPVAFAFADPMLNAAALEMAAGFLQVLTPPDEESAWYRTWKKGPSGLKEAFEARALLFTVFGARRAFQDSTVADGKEWAAEKLFHHAPGDQTRKHNKDFGAVIGDIGLGTAMVALYAMQSHASQGGPGFRTSLAGGGPLRAVPDVGDTLFRKAWALALPDSAFQALGTPSNRDEDVFPWLSPKPRRYTRADTPASHLYMACPRRILLSEPTSEGRCRISGVEGPMVSVIREAQNGPEYTNGGWEHPLTPYRQVKKSGTISSLPVLASAYPSGTSWKDRVGLVVSHRGQDGSGVEASLAVRAWTSVRAGATLGDGRLSVRAYGIACDQAKVASYVLSEQPVIAVEPELEATYETLLVEAVHTAEYAAWHLRRIVEAIPPSLKDKDTTRVENLTIRFWSDTEAAMDDFSEAMVAAVREEGLEGTNVVKERFLVEIGDAALGLFDDSFRDAWALRPEATAMARERVSKLCRQRDVRERLGLPPLVRKEEEKAA